MIKEERADLVKHHLWVLWTDYFKPEHLEKHPELHGLFWTATKAAGESKKTTTSPSARSCSIRSPRSTGSSGRRKRAENASRRAWSAGADSPPETGGSASNLVCVLDRHVAPFAGSPLSQTALIATTRAKSPARTPPPPRPALRRHWHPPGSSRRCQRLRGPGRMAGAAASLRPSPGLPGQVIRDPRSAVSAASPPAWRRLSAGRRLTAGVCSLVDWRGALDVLEVRLSAIEHAKPLQVLAHPWPDGIESPAPTRRPFVGLKNGHVLSERRVRR